MIRLAPLATVLLALSACSGYEEEEPVDAVTQSEAEALDDAAEVIEERRLPDGVFAEDAAGEAGEGAMPADASPSDTGGPEAMELPSE